MLLLLILDRFEVAIHHEILCGVHLVMLGQKSELLLFYLHLNLLLVLGSVYVEIGSVKVSLLRGLVLLAALGVDLMFLVGVGITSLGGIARVYLSGVLDAGWRGTHRFF